MCIVILVFPFFLYEFPRQLGLQCYVHRTLKIQEMFHFCKLCSIYVLITYVCASALFNVQYRLGEFLSAPHKWCDYEENLFVRKIFFKCSAQQFDLHSFIRYFKVKLLHSYVCTLLLNKMPFFSKESTF